MSSNNYVSQPFSKFVKIFFLSDFLVAPVNNEIFNSKSLQIVRSVLKCWEAKTDVGTKIYSSRYQHIINDIKATTVFQNQHHPELTCSFYNHYILPNMSNYFFCASVNSNGKFKRIKFTSNVLENKI